MKTLYTLPLLLTLTATGCATVPPSSSEMERMPVVRFGDTAPATPFVLLYPAGTPLPVTASITGTLLEKSDEATLKVTLKQDIYRYKQWASFDGKHWQRGDKLVHGEYRITLPGDNDGHTPGSMAAEFNLK